MERELDNLSNIYMADRRAEYVVYRYIFFSREPHFILGKINFNVTEDRGGGRIPEFLDVGESRSTSD